MSAAVQIREATPADMAAITAIYAESVANGRGTFELEPPDAIEMTARFAAVQALGLPRLVAEIDGALLDALILACEALGLRQMVAVIGDSDNAGSIALHRARGFADAGVFKAAGWKHDDWRDVVFMQRELGAGGQTPPDAPGLPLVDKKPVR